MHKVTLKEEYPHIHHWVFLPNKNLEEFLDVLAMLVLKYADRVPNK